MTNNNLTDERIDDLLYLFRCGLATCPEPTEGEFLRALVELQQYRKAAGEPVGYVSESALFGLRCGQHDVITGNPEKNGNNEHYWDVVPLYTAPTTK